MLARILARIRSGRSGASALIHLIAFIAEHLRRILAKYATHHRMRPAHAPSSGSETLLRIKSLAVYIIGTKVQSWEERALGGRLKSKAAM